MIPFIKWAKAHFKFITVLNNKNQLPLALASG